MLLNIMERPISKTSRGFSDAMIRQFLLAGLEPKQQSAFEESLFTDGKLEQRVRLMEHELTDYYAFERLNPSEQKLFEKNFLVSGDRKNQLKVSRALRDRFGPAAAAHTPRILSSFAERLTSMFNLRQLSWRFAFAVLLFLLLVGTVWLSIKKEPQIKEEITRRLSGKRVAPQTTPFESNHPNNPSAPEHEIMPSPMPEHERTIQSPMSVALAPDVTREKASSIALPQGDHSLVHFELTLKSNQSSEYRAELVTAEGETVLEGTATVSASSDIVSFDVPARLLKKVTYQIRLLNAGSNVTVATYYFRVG